MITSRHADLILEASRAKAGQLGIAVSVVVMDSGGNLKALCTGRNECSGLGEVTMTPIRKILITGAGSGLGEGTAIGLARNGQDVIATAQTWPQVTALRAKVMELGLPLRVEKLDLMDPYEVVEVVPEPAGKFRNIFPSFVEDLLKAHQVKMFQLTI
jgi:hypothetical protein